jgi:D-psicose/D-tagatose/L-ribulose 3-epimerase
MKQGLLSIAMVLCVLPGMAQTPKNVLVGYCTGLKNLEPAKAAGFDYVELGATEIANLTDEEFAAAAARIKALGISTPVANLFLPGTLKVTGPDIQEAALGTGIVVFGSGGARRVPDGFAKEDAFKQLVDFGRRAAREAAKHNITIAIEPLRRQESNIINTAAEGLELVKAIDHPNFQLMIDFFHLASEKEDPEIVIRAKDHLRHLHFANPTGRVFPLKWDEFDYAPFFANLKKIGYDKRISMEGSTKDLATEGPITVALLKKAFQ